MSGYPIKLVEWKRGNPLSAAPVIATGEANDISMNAGDVGMRTAAINDHAPVNYFDTRQQVRTTDGRWVDLPVPVDAELMGWSAIASSCA